jgi:predicted GNAT family acetyltransferase
MAQPQSFTDVQPVEEPKQAFSEVEPVSLSEQLQNMPEFLSKNPADQTRFLNEHVPEFKQSRPEEQAQFLAHVTKQPTGGEPQPSTGVMNAISDTTVGALKGAYGGLKKLGAQGLQKMAGPPVAAAKSEDRDLTGQSTMGVTGFEADPTGAGAAALGRVTDKMAAKGAEVGSMGAEGVVQTLHPGLSAEETVKQHPTQVGVARGVGGTVGGMVADPKMWALSAIPGESVMPAVSKLIAAGFMSQMAPEAAEKLQDVVTHWDEMKPEERAEQLTALGISATMLALTAAHAQHGLTDKLAETHGNIMDKGGYGRVAAAPVRAISTVAKPLSHIAPSVGGIMVASELGVPHPFIVGGGLGRFFLPPAMLERIFDAGRNLGLTKEEVDVKSLQEKYNEQYKEHQDNEKEYKAYDAHREQGGTASEEVLKKYEKSKAALQHTQEALQAAQDNYSQKLAERQAKRTGQAPTEQPITPADVALARPDQPTPTKEQNDAKLRGMMEQIAPTEKPAPVPANVKTPGQVQPETFPQEPRPLPRAESPLGTVQLAGPEGERGVIQGKQRLLGAGTPEAAPTPAATAPTPLGQVALPEKPKTGRLGTLKVDDSGKVIDQEHPLQQKIEEGLQGTAKPVAVKPATSVAEAPKAEAPRAEAPKAEAPKTENNLSDDDRRALEHRIGKSNTSLLDTPAGVDTARRLIRGTNRQFSDMATYLGLEGGSGELGAWLPEDFKRSRAAHGSDLSPVKERVINELLKQFPDQNELLEATEHWGPEKDQSKMTSEERAEAQEKLAKKGQTGGSQEAEEEATNTDEAIAKEHNENGGSSLLKNGKVEDGYSVGINKELEKVLNKAHVEPEDIKEYRESPAVKKALEENPKAFVGTWVDGRKTYLDTSIHEPDLETAKKIARDNKQLAIFDAKNKTSINVEPEGVHEPGEPESDMEMIRRGATPPEKLKPYKDMTPEEQEALAAKGVSGGAPGKALPTGDELIKKYGESDGDPAHTAFILKDGRGVAQTGTIHDEMLGGKATDENPRREQFVDLGHIRMRSYGAYGDRQFNISIPESGITPVQLKELKRMAPQMGTGRVYIEIGKPGGKSVNLDYGKANAESIESALRELAPVTPEGGGGSQGASDVKLPKLAEQHLLPEEKAGVAKSPQQLSRFVENMTKLPKVREFIDAAIKGAGERKWYQRSTAAFDAMTKEAPDYFDQPGDRDKFIGLLASSSPQQAVVENMKEALRVWTNYVDNGRPTGEALEKLLSKSKAEGGFTIPGAKIPNTMKALAGEPLWPDITKNKNFKVPSFRDNLTGMLNRVTNDGWMALFSGLEARDISSAHSYHPISVMTRAAADELGWEPAEAQAAVWAFIKTLTDKGVEAAEDPHQMRQYSEDFADIMRNDPQTRGLLKDMGVSHAELDKRLDAIEAKPAPDTSGGRPTAEDSTRRAVKRVEEARGKGAIPSAKTGLLNFGESEAEGGGGSDETSFNPETFKTRTSDVKVTPLSERPSKTILSVKVDGERAGQLSMTPMPDLGKDAMEISTSQLGEAFRGKGHGTEMYKQAIEYAKSKGVKTLYSDDQVSTKADNVWQSLVRKGDAKWDSSTKRYKITISPLGKVTT